MSIGKTRFSPSPTGHMHLGNVRVALYNALMAIKLNVPYVLRVEDTDQTRSTRAFEDMLIEDLNWLGISPQEGPREGGPNAPYRQSERGEIYAEYFAQLQEAGEAYPCFCRPESLAKERKFQLKQGKPPRYSGLCRALSQDEVQAKIEAGEQPTLRLHMPDDIVLSFDDLVKGPQKFLGKDIGDFIIRRGDGAAAFMFCNAVDDAHMEIGMVIRGEDHLTNTPRQLRIFDVLNLKAPRYGHIALIVNEKGSPFSKRDGSLSIDQLRAAGYLPLAIHNYLVRTGHQIDGDNQLLNLQEMGAAFETSALSRSPARFDLGALQYWQKQALAQCSDAEVLEWLSTKLDDRLSAAQQADFVRIIRENICFPNEVSPWLECVTQPTLSPDALKAGQAVFAQAGAAFFDASLELLPEAFTSADDFKTWTAAIKAKTDCGGKHLFHPLRFALTGRTDGPNLGELICLLDHQFVVDRLQTAKQAI